MDTKELAEALRKLNAEQEARLADSFNRSLPFQDGFFDRWERAERLGFGEKASIYNSTLVFGDVSVGEGTWVGPFVVLDGSAGLTIGKFCSISSGVQIYTHDTVAWALSGGKAPPKRAPVAIADCCYIGSQSIVAAGVTIGTQAVVAANSFVNRDVPPRTIVGGSPARPLGRVEIDGDDIQLRYD
ncbi:acyltransferase [Sphingoaurantiacus capsulatus]|uniref:Acyltransferase n=1 Tax=Sphingoaurantiacus capsulatus TaxID=1771310 RepID=A0ABV7X946_9SPHN